MKKAKILLVLNIIALLILVFLVKTSNSTQTSLEERKKLTMVQEESDVKKPTRNDVEVPTKPENGIPLVVITVYEDENVVAKANEEDDEHEYGTIEDINNSEDHSVRGKGNIEIILPENYEGEYGSIEVPEGTQELDYIKGRGNSTWNKIKKPYKIKYEDGQNLFGMGKNKEWGLLANYRDFSLSNNAISMWIANKFGMDYTMQMVPVDVVMKGTQSGDVYLGSYYLTELVDFGEGRIEEPELKKKETEDITGGYLLSIFFLNQDYDKSRSTIFRTKYSGLKLINENPEFESEDLEEGRKLQREYIRDYINQIDEIIMNNDVIEGESHEKLAELMDLESLADFYLMQEFLVNIDAFKTSSNYFYKKPDGKLYWGPLWDFDWIFFRVEADSPETYTGFNLHKENPWIDNLRYKDEEFVKLLQERWKVLNPILEEVTEEGGILDKYRERGRASWEDNYEIWYDNDYFSEVEIDYDKEFENLRNLINLRREWFNKNISNIGRETFTLTYELDGLVIKTEEYKAYSYVYELSEGLEREGATFEGWANKDTGEKVDFFMIDKDMTLVPIFK